MFNLLESPTRSTQHSPIRCLFAVKRSKKVKASKSQYSCLTPLASPWWLLSYFHECPCSIVSFPHIIHNLEEPERKKEPPTTSIQKRDFSIALAGKRKKKRDLALVYPWLPWLYCCLSWAGDAIKVLGEKWLGKGCNCRRRNHTQVLQG